MRIYTERRKFIKTEASATTISGRPVATASYRLVLRNECLLSVRGA